MANLLQRYVEYRSLGFGRIDAFRFAWLVATARLAPLPLRVRSDGR
jgi:hypothetical protein